MREKVDKRSLGNWKGSTPIPDESFESREQWLEGEDRPLFFRCLRRMLCWMPEERSTADDLTCDEFMMQHLGDIQDLDAAAGGDTEGVEEPNEAK